MVLKKINLNRKAMFFTILAITLLTLFMVSYSVYSFVQDRETIDKRIRTMNNFASSLDKDMQRKMYIVSYRIIFLLEQNVSKYGGNVDSVENRTREAFFYGTLYGKDYVNSNGKLLFGTTFNDIINLTNIRAKSVNVNVSLLNPVIHVSQDDPWNVKVSLTADLLIKDIGNLAIWNRTATFNSYIPISNFEDPLYIKNSNGLMTNKVIKSPYSFPTTDPNNLTKHILGKYYINSTSGPNFIERLEGNFSADANGVESIVYMPELSKIPGVIVMNDKPVIDYIYFNDANHDTATSIPLPGMDWVKMNSTYESSYLT